MPLHKVIHVSENSRVGIWHVVGEVLDDLLTQAPSSWLPHLQNIHPQKQLHRLCAYLLLQNLTGHTDLSLMYDQYNKPHLLNSTLKISLSHSGDWVVASTHTHEATGIDVEQLKPKIHTIAPKFLKPQELNRPEAQTTEGLTIMWCIKEALYKIHGQKSLSMKDHLLIEPFDLSQPDPIQAHIQYHSYHQSHFFTFERLDTHYLMTYPINTF